MLVPLSYNASLGLYSASPGPYGSCTYLPLFALIPVPLVQLDSTGIVPSCPCPLCTYVSVLVSYLRIRACIRAQCFVMGNPSHARVLVFGLSRSNCIATPIDMDSLLVMSCDVFCFFVCIRAGCLYLTCRGAIVCLPVCTANREGWQPRLICTMYIIHNDFHVLCSTSSVVGVR